MFPESYILNDFLEEENISLIEEFTLISIEELKKYLMQLKLYPINSIEFKWILNEVLTKLGIMRLIAESLFLEEVDYIENEEEDVYKYAGKNIYKIIDEVLKILDQAEKYLRKENDILNALTLITYLDKYFSERLGLNYLSDAE